MKKTTGIYKTGQVLIILLSLTMITAFPVFANDGADNDDPTRLENLYQRELELFERQTEQFTRAAELIPDIEAAIEKRAADGFDTTEAEAALASFQTALAEAQNLHDQAADIFATHTGFDQDGKVTDRDEAFTTVLTAGQLLKDVRQTLVQAFTALKASYREIKADATLEAAFARAREGLPVMEERLSKSEQIVERLAEFITNQDALGRDTSILQTALQTFEAGVAEIEAQINTASELVNTHEGFDQDGNVIDTDSAQSTIESIRSALTGLRSQVSDILSSLRETVRDFLQQFDQDPLAGGALP